MSGRHPAVLVGFAALLILLVGAGVGSTRALAALEADSARIRQDYRARSRLLEHLRADIYLSSTLVRDHLIGPAGHAPSSRDAALLVHQRLLSTLNQYSASCPAADRPVVARLGDEIDAYWRVVEPVLALPGSTDASRAALLSTEVLPRRNDVVVLARRVADLSEREFDTAEEALVARAERERRRLRQTTVLAGLLGVVVALLTIRRLDGLEAAANARYDDATSARADLRRLSASLVTAQEEERRRLSRELHDEVGQSLSALAVDLAGLRASSQGAAPDVAERLSDAHRLAVRTVASVRNMALSLRPSMLDDLGLVPALAWQAREVSRRSGIDVHVTADDVPETLPDELRTCVYRCVQEALANCVQHSRAGRVQVTVRLAAGDILASVVDDGVGFDPRVTKGLGLLGIEERVEPLGGTVQVDSAPGRGTVVTVRLPLTATRREAGPAA
jgi:signal transduction histidine kinase